MSSVIKDTPRLTDFYKVLMMCGAKPQSCETRRQEHDNSTQKPVFPNFTRSKIPASQQPLRSLLPISWKLRRGRERALGPRPLLAWSPFAFILQARMCLLRTYAGLSCVATLVGDKTVAGSLRGWVSYLLGRGRGLRLVPPPADGGVRKRLTGEWACLHDRLTEDGLLVPPLLLLA